MLIGGHGGGSATPGGVLCGCCARHRQARQLHELVHGEAQGTHQLLIQAACLLLGAARGAGDRGIGGQARRTGGAKQLWAGGLCTSRPGATYPELLLAAFQHGGSVPAHNAFEPVQRPEIPSLADSQISNVLHECRVAGRPGLLLRQSPCRYRHPVPCWRRCGEAAGANRGCRVPQNPRPGDASAASQRLLVERSAERAENRHTQPWALARALYDVLLSNTMVHNAKNAGW